MAMMINRRAFLGASAATGLGLLGGGCMQAMSGATGTASGATTRPFFRDGGPQIGLQLYTLGDEVAADLAATLARVAAIGYTEIQLPQLYGKTPREIRGWADAAGLRITSLHLPGAAFTPGTTAITLTSPPQAIIDVMGALGAREVAMPIMLFPPDMRPRAGEGFREMIVRAASAADVWHRTAAFLNEKGDALSRGSIRLSYHNHNMEFAPVGDTTGWDILVRETSPALVAFEVDVGWVATAGRDPVAVMRSITGRVSQLHVKDVAATNSVNFGLTMNPSNVGQGAQDWASILPAASAAGCDHFFLEQEPPFTGTRMQAVEQGYAYLAGLQA
jgi:sugar phosphate isomerase/epimerase